MIEGSNHIVAIESDDELERSAVAGVAAVERLIAGRNNLRDLLAAHEREFAASRAVQHDHKRQLAMLHQRYIELATLPPSSLASLVLAERRLLATALLI